LYWHPVSSKQFRETAPVMQPGLYTHVKSVLIYAPLPPCTRGHGAGSVSLRLSQSSCGAGAGVGASVGPEAHLLPPIIC